MSPSCTQLERSGARVGSKAEEQDVQCINKKNVMGRESSGRK